MPTALTHRYSGSLVSLPIASTAALNAFSKMTSKRGHSALLGLQRRDQHNAN